MYGLDVFQKNNATTELLISLRQTTKISVYLLVSYTAEIMKQSPLDDNTAFHLSPDLCVFNATTCCLITSDNKDFLLPA
jgi:hypothetical protein